MAKLSDIQKQYSNVDFSTFGRAASSGGMESTGGGNTLANTLISLIPFGDITRKTLSGEKVGLGEFALEAGLSLVPYGLGKLGKGAKLARGAAKGLEAGQTAKKGSKLLPISKLTSYEGAPDRAAVDAYKAAIQAGDDIEPLKILRDSAGKLGVEDGKHRLQAFKELGMKDVPTIGDAPSNFLTRASEDLAVRGIRANPSQLTNFAKTHGEDLTATLKRHKLEGVDSEGIAKVTRNLQKSFDDIADNADVAVDSTAVRSAFDKEIARLKKSPVQTNKKLAKALETERDNVLSRLGGGLSDANTFRKDYDKATKSFGADPILSGPNRAAGTVMRGVVQDTADAAGLRGPQGENLRELGGELSKLYDLENIAGKQANLGRGTNPLGLVPAIAAGGFGTAGTVAGGPVGGLAGALLGVGASRAINNPNVIRGASRALGAAGEAVGSGLPGRAVRAAGAQAGVRAAAAPFGYGQPSESAQNLEAVPDELAQLPEAPIAPEVPQDDLSAAIMDMAMQAYEAGDTKGLERIAKLQAVLEAGQPKGAGKPLSSEANRQQANAMSGLQAIDQLSSLIQQDSSLPAKAAVPGGSLARRVTGSGEYDAARMEIVDVLARLRTGAAITAQEEQRFKQMLPQPFDNPQTVAQKLDRYRQLFSQVLGSQPSGQEDLASVLAGL